MTRCRYLEGEKLDIRTAQLRRDLIGKHVRYLRNCDIDRSGRGYIFPKVGKIEQVKSRSIWFDDGAVELVGDIIEMELLP